MVKNALEHVIRECMTNPGLDFSGLAKSCSILIMTASAPEGVIETVLCAAQSTP